MLKKKQQVSVSIAPSAIFWVIFSYILYKFFFNVLPIILIFVIGLLISVALNPLITSLEKKNIPRGATSLVTLLLIFAGIISIPVSIALPLVDQTSFFIQKLPDLVNSVVPSTLNLDINSILPQMTAFPNYVYRFVSNTFSSVITIFALLVISYYLLQERPNWLKNLKFVFGDSKGEKYFHIAEEIELKLGYWTRGELLLMLIVGILNYFGFLLIGIPFAIPLALIAGILEIVPNIGPTIAAFPAAIVGFSVSPSLGFAAIIVSILVQQLENNLLVPKIMQSAVGLNPIITMMAVMMGYHLGGAPLAILSLPIVLTGKIILSHIRISQLDNMPELD